jgi:hypothetical protein
MLRVRASRDGGGRTDFIMVSKLVLTFACDASNDKAWITSSCEINLKDAAGIPYPLLNSGCHPFSSPASRGAFFAAIILTRAAEVIPEIGPFALRLAPLFTSTKKLARVAFSNTV